MCALRTLAPARATGPHVKRPDDQPLSFSADIAAPTYPPYNIEKTGENAYRISIAVAGFSADDLNVEMKDGAVIVMTMWVREGAEKTEYRVARQLAPGEKFDVELGQTRNATGFRISDKGPGRYKIGVR